MRAADDASWARKSEDLTFDKTDDKDAVLIARLTGELRCYLPEPVDETWGRLRHLGTRRAQLLEEHVAACSSCGTCSSASGPPSWPRRAPVQVDTWVAALSVMLDRDGGELDRTRRLGRPGSNGGARRDHPARRDTGRACGSCARCSPP